MLKVLIFKLIVLPIGPVRGRLILLRLIDVLIQLLRGCLHLVLGFITWLNIYLGLLQSFSLLQQLDHMVHVMVHHQVGLLVSSLGSALRSNDAVVLVELEVDEFCYVVEVYHALVKPNTSL